MQLEAVKHSLLVHIACEIFSRLYRSGITPSTAVTDVATHSSSCNVEAANIVPPSKGKIRTWALKIFVEFSGLV